MQSFDEKAAPVADRWVVVRGTTNGDHGRKTLQFFDVFKGDDHPDNVVSDISGSTWASNVAQEKGGDPITTPTVVVDLALAEVTPTLTDEQVRLLTHSTYNWDLVEDPGLVTELTWIIGTMSVIGRATP